MSLGRPKSKSAILSYIFCELCHISDPEKSIETCFDCEQEMCEDCLENHECIWEEYENE